MDPQLVRTPNEQHQLRMAHVLFIDVVEYTKLKMRDQLGVYLQLTDIVLNTDEYCRKQASEPIICRPLGDGMAVVFFADPSAPVRCAIEINESIRRQGLVRLRMGLHSGPVFCVTDINQQRDVNGEGINTAQRVMASGDPNHILMSRTMAEILLALGDWNHCISEIGPVGVKHGAQVFLYNFSGNEFGNPNPPTSAAKAKPLARAAAVSSSSYQPTRAVGTEAFGSVRGLPAQPQNQTRTQFRDCGMCGMLLPHQSVSCSHCGGTNV